MDIENILFNTLYEDEPGDFTMSPAIAYFVFDSVNFDFEKTDDIIEEDIYSDTRKEIKALKRKKTSKVTGTVYKLTPEQKRCLKYLKKKYGSSLVNEIKIYRKKTLAPYQVAKTYLDKSKALYVKEVFGMTKEEYLKSKKTAEEKIANMRSNKYSELSKEMDKLHKKEMDIDGLEDFLKVKNISEPALNKVFKKYGIYSNRFTDEEMNKFQSIINNASNIRNELIRKIAKDGEISKEDKDSLIDAIKAIEKKKKSLITKSSSQKEKISKEISDKLNSMSDIDGLDEISIKISNSNISQEKKDDFSEFLDSKTSISGEKITRKSFDDEYENYLMRKQIISDIKNRVDNKYTDDYKKALSEIKEKISDKKSDIYQSLAKERNSKHFTEIEKKIYELKPGAMSDSDDIRDYVLKIKESDFFEPRYYQKSDRLKNAEKEIDASIKRFERSLESKMEPKDFQLLKKYRLINNLVTVKNVKTEDLFKKR